MSVDVVVVIFCARASIQQRQSTDRLHERRNESRARSVYISRSEWIAGRVCFPSLAYFPATRMPSSSGFGRCRPYVFIICATNCICHGPLTWSPLRSRRGSRICFINGHELPSVVVVVAVVVVDVRMVVTKDVDAMRDAIECVYGRSSGRWKRIECMLVIQFKSGSEVKSLMKLWLIMVIDNQL